MTKRHGISAKAISELSRKSKSDAQLGAAHARNRVAPLPGGHVPVTWLPVPPVPYAELLDEQRWSR